MNVSAREHVRQLEEYIQFGAQRIADHMGYMEHAGVGEGVTLPEDLIEVASAINEFDYDRIKALETDREKVMLTICAKVGLSVAFSRFLRHVAPEHGGPMPYSLDQYTNGAPRHRSKRAAYVAAYIQADFEPDPADGGPGVRYEQETWHVVMGKWQLWTEEQMERLVTHRIRSVIEGGHGHAYFPPTPENVSSVMKELRTICAVKPRR